MTTENELEQVKEALKKAVLTGEFHIQHGVKDELRLQALRVIMSEIEPALESLEKYTDRQELQSDNDKLIEVLKGSNVVIGRVLGDGISATELAKYRKVIRAILKEIGGE